jgi:Glyoxalase/Bleomycin resistance protein/Dioxygenase superfamily
MSGSAFSELIQVGVVVKDVEKTIERLTSLGFGPFEPKIFPPDAKQWFRGEPMDAKFKIFATRMGPVEFELIQPVEGKSPHREFLDRKGEGIQHLAFAVKDLAAEINQLTRKGSKVELKANLQDADVAYIDLNIGGLVVELIQKK